MNRAKFELAMLQMAFDESKHPRGKRGTRSGGKFVSKQEALDASDAADIAGAFASNHAEHGVAADYHRKAIKALDAARTINGVVHSRGDNLIAHHVAQAAYHDRQSKMLYAKQVAQQGGRGTDGMTKAERDLIIANRKANASTNKISNAKAQTSQAGESTDGVLGGAIPPHIMPHLKKTWGMYEGGKSKLKSGIVAHQVVANYHMREANSVDDDYLSDLHRDAANEHNKAAHEASKLLPKGYESGK